MKPKILTLLIGIQLALCVSITPVFAQNSNLTPANYDNSTDLHDWIVKSVCADAVRPYPADPYYTCPSGTTRRKIQIGDPLPYYNFDQINVQESDSFPLIDVQGNPIYFHTFDYKPFRQFQLYSATDGDDFYSVDNKWVSAAGTRDGGGYNTQFFGENCSYGGGWVFFPTNGFLSGGHEKVAIFGRHWEQEGDSYPGACPTKYSNPITYWELHKNFPFGGVNGNAGKNMDAMVSYHGFTPGHKYDPNDPNDNYHLEVFYFTQQYGLTMWQSWHPVGPYQKKTNSCNMPDTMQFQGIDWIVTDCRDWSNVQLATTAEIPQWPLPTANVLTHSHFDDGGRDIWQREGNSTEGNIINWNFRNSTFARDIKLAPNGAGVRYLAINCAGTCTGADVQKIYQDVSIDQITKNGTYLYGVDARSESGSGTLQISLQELDASNKVLWQDSVQGTVLEDNGDGRKDEIHSVYSSTAFIHKMTSIPILSGATKVRFSITPITKGTFDILDSWFNPFPEINSIYYNLENLDVLFSQLVSQMKTNSDPELSIAQETQSTIEQAIGYATDSERQTANSLLWQQDFINIQKIIYNLASAHNPNAYIPTLLSHEGTLQIKQELNETINLINLIGKEVQQLCPPVDGTCRQWGACSVTACGVAGTQTCIESTSSQCGGASAPITQNCIGDAPVNGTCTAWSTCSSSCGGGTQTCTTSTEIQCGGVSAIGKIKSCNTQSCVVPEGSYKETCSDCSLSGNNFSCNCTNEYNSPKKTSINLSRCPGPLENYNGTLTCDKINGSYTEYNNCRNCSLNNENNELTCSCKDKEGRFKSSSLNLVQCPGYKKHTFHLSDDDGNLKC